MRKIYARTVILASSLFAVLAFAQAAAPQTTPPPSGPNVVLVMTDDMTKADFQRVPQIGWALGGEYASFQQAYVTTSLCCPSRATTLSGKYAHNHLVHGNLASSGQGFLRYKEGGWPGKDLPNWLQVAGYETVLVGKYLNGYRAEAPPQPGWTEWYAAGSPTRTWNLNENGTVHHYPQDKASPKYRHFDDVLTDKAVSYVNKRSVTSAPFFMWVGYHAPHGPHILPRRHEGRFSQARLPKPPGFNEKDVSDKPKWVRRLAPLSHRKIEGMAQNHRGRLASLLSVADGIRRIREALATAGELHDTYFIFTSDNGYHQGEHRLEPGKRTPYQPDARVPLIVTGPSVTTGGREHLTLNTDFAPTVADLAGAISPYEPDGRSFVPLLGTPRPGHEEWRQRFMEENWRTAAVPGEVVPPTYRAVISNSYVYNRYETGEKEYYNIVKDPHELNNRARDLDRAAKQRLNTFWMALKDCDGKGCRVAEE
jgi:N-acetylglucosamine-6-sulfatase